MAGYLGTKAVFLSTTAASVTGNAEITGDLTVDTNTLHVDSTNNNVGIGTSSPAFISGGGLHVHNSTVARVKVTNTTTGTASTDGSELQAFEDDLYLLNREAAGKIVLATNNTDRMTVDASGNVLVGTTSKTPSISAVEGIALSSGSYGGRLEACRDGGAPASFGRLTSDGDIMDFKKNGTTVGSIGTASGGLFIGGALGATAYLFMGNNVVKAATSAGGGRDNVIDLGDSFSRFDDIYATNGTIQTSDRNEKQQIASLTDAEMQAAKAISTLFKTFKWNDKVAEKGDAARKHAGVIAQDVQQAMADAGLDAGDYAFFISSTWWETQTEVPAVEAVAAQDAVYDEEGNLISEAVEAVEAREAYTRTDTYDTAEEAPEGATERTRLGIRYPELLAFIGAATEQRLASIEARLDAIEGV